MKRKKKLALDSDSDNAEENKNSCLADSKSHGIKSSSSVKNLKSKDLEYKKPVNFVNDDEPAGSFLKTLTSKTVKALERSIIMKSFNLMLLLIEIESLNL